MNYLIDIQQACQDNIPVSDEILRHWVELTLKNYRERAEVTIRFVTQEEMTTLNATYRQHNKVTNVLAFTSNLPIHVELEYPFLGDVIICPAVLQQESLTLQTPLVVHWAHIVIHGVLHLLGYDHIEENESNIMQAIEIDLLNTLNFDNPYLKDNYGE